MALTFLSGPITNTERTVALSAGERPSEVSPAPSGGDLVATPGTECSGAWICQGRGRKVIETDHRLGLLKRLDRAVKQNTVGRDRRRRSPETPSRGGRISAGSNSRSAPASQRAT